MAAEAAGIAMGDAACRRTGAGYYRPEYRRDYEDRGPQLRLDFGRGPTAGAPKSLAAKPPIRIISAGSSVGRSTMARGTVKWFNPTKGYGFIQRRRAAKTCSSTSPQSSALD
jgi:hypothetical protein